MEKIVYDYKSRDDIISGGMIKALEYVYSISYPTPEKPYLEMCKEFAEKKGTPEYEELKKSGWPYAFFYLPDNVLREVWDNWKNAYGIEDKWHGYLKFLIDKFFTENGIKEIYSPTEWSNGESVRHCVDQKLVKELISDTIGDKVSSPLKDELVKSLTDNFKEYLQEFSNTYRFDSREVLSAASLYMSTPNCNRDTVIKLWKEHFNKDIEIPSDDCWVDIYQYEDEEYESQQNEEL